MPRCDSESCRKPSTSIARKLECKSCCKVSYCSKACQVTDWPRHVFDCNHREPTSADYLVLAAHSNLMPTHPQTLIDYGFNRAIYLPEQKNLHAMFIELIVRRNINAKTLHRWRTEGRLLEAIKAKFLSGAEGAEGVFYRWMLEHEWLLDGKNPDPMEIDAIFLRKSLIYSGGDPSLIYSGGDPSSLSTLELLSLTTTWPSDKIACLAMVSNAMRGLCPKASSPLWMSFGFCAGTGDQEAFLAHQYFKLVSKCTFQELCDSHRSHNLVTLFRSHGLANDLRSILMVPFFEGFFQREAEGQRLPVWDLKQYVVCYSRKDPIPMAPVLADFGFNNCESESEENELKDAYSTFFHLPISSPPGLQDACMEGKIFDFMSRFIQLKKNRMKRLMKNRYSEK